MKALVLIDLQNGFITDATSHIPARIEQLLQHTDKWDFVVATQFKNTPNSPYVNFLGWKELMSKESQALLPAVENNSHYIFTKSGYTCFTEEFKAFVHEHDITDISLAGVDTNCCVLASAISAFENSIKTEVLEHYCASNGGAVSHEAGIECLKWIIGENAIVYEENSCRK